MCRYHIFLLYIIKNRKTLEKYSAGCYLECNILQYTYLMCRQKWNHLEYTKYDKRFRKNVCLVCVIRGK